MPANLVSSLVGGRTGRAESTSRKRAMSPREQAVQRGKRMPCPVAVERL